MDRSPVESQGLVEDVHKGTIFVKKSKEIQSPKEQIAAFRKAARDLGCDESEDRFKKALRTIAKQKPKSKPETRE